MFWPMRIRNAYKLHTELKNHRQHLRRSISGPRGHAEHGFIAMALYRCFRFVTDVYEVGTTVLKHIL